MYYNKLTSNWKEKLTESEFITLINHYLNSKDADTRYKKVLKMRFLDGKTYTEISKALGVSKTNPPQIIARAIPKAISLMKWDNLKQDIVTGTKVINLPISKATQSALTKAKITNVSELVECQAHHKLPSLKLDNKALSEVKSVIEAVR